MSLATPTGLDARLYFLTLGSPDPDALVAFHADVFGTERITVDGAPATFGAERGLIAKPGKAKTLLGAAYAVADQETLSALAARLVAGGVAVEEVGHDLFAPGAIAFRDPDGNRIEYGLARRPAVAPGALPARLQHVVVGSTDPDRMVAFYQDLVGMTVSDRVMDDAGALKTCFLRSNEEHHSFAVFKTSENRFDHQSYEVLSWNDIRDWGDRLAERHLRVQWGPGRHGPGNNLFLFFHDADGNWIEISAEIEVCAVDRPAGAWPHEERTLNSWGPGFLRT